MIRHGCWIQYGLLGLHQILIWDGREMWQFTFNSLASAERFRREVSYENRAGRLRVRLATMLDIADKCDCKGVQTLTSADDPIIKKFD